MLEILLCRLSRNAEILECSTGVATMAHMPLGSLYVLSQTGFRRYCKGPNHYHYCGSPMRLYYIPQI